jgi:hypothetical protein
MSLSFSFINFSTSATVNFLFLLFHFSLQSTQDILGCTPSDMVGVYDVMSPFIGHLMKFIYSVHVSEQQHSVPFFHSWSLILSHYYYIPL